LVYRVSDVVQRNRVAVLELCIRVDLDNPPLAVPFGFRHRRREGRVELEISIDPDDGMERVVQDLPIRRTQIPYRVERPDAGR